MGTDHRQEVTTAPGDPALHHAAEQRQALMQRVPRHSAAPESAVTDRRLRRPHWPPPRTSNARTTWQSSGNLGSLSRSTISSVLTLHT